MADDEIFMTSELFRFHIRAPLSWTWKHMMCISFVLINVCIGPSMIEVGSVFHAPTQSTIKEDHTVYTLVMWSCSLFSFSEHRNCSSNGLSKSKTAIFCQWLDSVLSWVRYSYCWYFINNMWTSHSFVSPLYFTGGKVLGKEYCSTASASQVSSCI